MTTADLTGQASSQGQASPPPSALPFISVILPTFNGTATLGRALESLAQQSYPSDRYEVIVVDDGSTQDVAAVVAAFDVRLCILATNIGPGAARNVGLDMVVGDVVACLDDDCVADRDWLRCLAEGFTVGEPTGVGGAIVSRGDHAGLAARYLAATETGTPPPVTTNPANSIGRRLVAYVAKNYRTGTPPPLVAEVCELYGGNAAIRTHSLRAIGGWDTSMRGIEDTDACRRLLAHDPTSRFLSVSTAKVAHEPHMSLSRLLHRALSRGPVRLRYYRRNGFVPPIFPFPFLVLLAVAVTAVVALPAAPVAALLTPQVLYAWWWRLAWLQRSAVPLLFPYLQLAEETANVVGLAMGYGDASATPAAQRAYSPARSWISRHISRLRIGVRAAERRAQQTGDDVWLTFDDYGSREQVEQVLAILADHDVRAMFFFIGRWADEHPELVARVAAAGHVLGNHTYSHADLLCLSPTERESELAQGVPSTLLRPPMGRYDRAVRAQAREHGLSIAYWEVDSDDWQGVSQEYIHAKVMHETRRGSVLLFHLFADNTLAVLPRLIADLCAKNLTLAPLSSTAAQPVPANHFSRVKSLFDRVRHDDLSRNAAFLMASTGIMSVIGFVFWVFVAHLYTNTDIGLASAVVSISVLISSVSTLGLNVALIRFLPSSRSPSGDINAALLTVGAVTMLVSAGYALAGTTLSSKLPFFTADIGRGTLFCFLLAVITLNSLTDSVFIAARRAHYHTLAYTLFGTVRLVLAVLLVRQGALGIFLAYSAAGTAALLISLYYMRRGCDYHLLTRPNFAVLRRTRQFTTDNYVAALLGQVPSKVVPTLIVARLGGSAGAYFAMAMTIAGLLYIVPTALEQSLLAEGANNAQRQRLDTIRAAKLLYALLTPAVVVALFGAPYLLQVFGADYSRGSTTTLQLLAVSALFLGVCSLGTTMLNVQQRSRWNTVIQGLTAAATLGWTYLLMPHGVAGVGLAFLLGSAVGALAHVFAQQVVWRGGRGSLPADQVSAALVTAERVEAS